MDYQKEQVETIKAANELQDTANKLEQKMINEIETNNRLTSKHNTAMKWLTGVIVLLSVITLWTNINKTGRYAIASSQGGAYILDTKSSELWIRTRGRTLYIGTNKNLEDIKITHE